MNRLVRSILATLLLGAAPSVAAVTFYGQPTAEYVGATTNFALGMANGTTFTSLTSGSVTMSSSGTLTKGTVPASWNNWGAPPNTESATPAIADSGSGVNSITLTFSQGLAIFGMEVQQASFSTLSLQADFYSGAIFLAGVTRTVTVPGAPNGASGDGAKLFAVGSTDMPITRVVMTAPSAANGFAMAQFRYAEFVEPVPEPGTVTQFLTGCAGLAALWRLRRRSSFSA